MNLQKADPNDTQELLAQAIYKAFNSYNVSIKWAREAAEKILNTKTGLNIEPAKRTS